MSFSSPKAMKVPAILRVNDCEITTIVSVKIEGELKCSNFTLVNPIILKSDIDITIPMKGIQSVYLIKGDKNNYKIGYGNPTERLRTFQTGSPHNMELIATCPGGKSLENTFHEKYKNKNIKGEWFKLLPKDVDEIKKVMAIKYLNSNHIENIDYWNVIDQKNIPDTPKIQGKITENQVIRDKCDHIRSQSQPTQAIVSEVINPPPAYPVYKTIISDLVDADGKLKLSIIAKLFNIELESYLLKYVCEIIGITESTDLNIIFYHLVGYINSRYNYEDLRDIMSYLSITLPPCEISMEILSKIISCLIANKISEDFCTYEDLKSALQIFGQPTGGKKNSLMSRFSLYIKDNISKTLVPLIIYILDDEISDDELNELAKINLSWFRCYEHDHCRDMLIIYYCKRLVSDDLLNICDKLRILLPEASISNDELVNIIKCALAVRNERTMCTCVELKEALKLFGLSVYGRKADLIERFADCLY